MSGHLLKRVGALFLCLILFTSSVSASVTIHFSEDETVTVRKEESTSPSEGESVHPENETEDHTEADSEYPSALTKDAEGIETEADTRYSGGETEAETENIYDETEADAENIYETEADIYMPAQTFTENTGTVFVVVNAPSGAFPEGTSMSVKDVEDQETLSTIEEAVSSRVSQIHAVDITFSDRDGREIEPLLPISVILTAEEKKEEEESLVIHVDNEGNAEEVPSSAISQEEVEKAAALVTDESAGSAKDTSGETAVDQGIANNPENEVKTDAEQPALKASDSVNSQMASAPAEPVEEISIPESGESVQFTVDQFSVYALVYTVDFYWEVDGKVYNFSIPGGGFVSFTELVEVLGIADSTNKQKNSEEEEESTQNPKTESDGSEENTDILNKNADTSAVAPLTIENVVVSDATRKFVADVASVKFSNPELVDISKIKEDTTVGRIKESRELDVQYSAELTKEQIEEINNRAVETGDWALISVQPFKSEETLTVTMTDGQEFVIMVSDAYNNPVTLHFVRDDVDGTSLNEIKYDDETISLSADGTFTLTVDWLNSHVDANGQLDLTKFVPAEGYTLSNTHKSTWKDLNDSTDPYRHSIIGNELKWKNSTLQYRLFYTNHDKAGSYWFDAGMEPRLENQYWQYNNGDPRYHDAVADTDTNPYDYYLVYSQTPSGSGSGGSNPDMGDIPEIGHTKEKTSNYDGTYNLELGVSSEAIEKKVEKHINVIMVVDTSSSMNKRYDSEDSATNPDSNPDSRIYQTRKAVTEFVDDLMANNQTDSNAVEMELITFDMGARVSQPWTGNAETFNNIVDNIPRHSGTNWAEALKLARTEALAKVENDSDPTYVLFLTDGAPSQYWDPDDLGTSYYVSGEGCYLGARDEARAAVRDGVNLYSIFSYGTTVDKNNDYLGKLMDYAYNNSSAKDVYRSYAGTGSELKDKLQAILNTIEERHFGAGNVQINDGITKLTTVTFEDVDPESFQYTIKYIDYDQNNQGTEHILTNGNGITVSGSGNSQTITIPSVTYHTWQNGVYKEVTTDEVTIKGAEFSNSPEKKVTWKLEKTDGSTYILEDNWTYNVKFKIWPSQDSYDLIAALNNGFLKWGEDFINGDHTIPFSEYEAQIDNTVTPYALKTNTTANVTYQKTTSTTVNGETTYSSGDSITVDLPTVDGMPLDNTKFTLEKVWNSTLTEEDKPNAVDLYILIDPTPEKIAAFNAAYAEALASPTPANLDAFASTYYYKAELNENGSWKSSISIAPGVYDQYGHMNTTGHTYMVMEPAIDGHYELEAVPTHPMLNGLTHDENDPNTIKDMVDVYGYNTSSLRVDDPSSYPPTYELDGQQAKYSVANTLKAGININKELVDVLPSQQDYLNMEEYFTIKVTLKDKNNAPVYDTTVGSGAVSYRIYAPAEIPEGATVVPDGAEGDNVTGYSINGITFTATKTEGSITDFIARGLIGTDGTVTLKIRKCDSLRIVNVPIGTTYTVEEIIDSKSDFDFKDIYWEVKKEGEVYEGKTSTENTNSTTQMIVPDAENNVVVRNKPKALTKDLSIKKTGANNEGLSGAIFQLLVKNGSGVYQPVTEVERYTGIKINGLALITSRINDVDYSSTFTSTGNIQTLSPLPVGGYKIIELQAPAGYVITHSEIEFAVTGQGITMITDTEGSGISFDAAPATGSAQLTVNNTPGIALPSTGGPGTRLFTILGSILIFGAGIILRRRWRLALE